MGSSDLSQEVQIAMSPGFSSQIIGPSGLSYISQEYSEISKT
jgi:hypothetical protein